MSYTPSYPAEMRLKSATTDEYAYMSFNGGVFDISTYTGASSDGPYNDYASMTINGRTLDIAVNLEPYEQLIQVTNGNYTGSSPAPLAITASTLGVNVGMTVGNNASLTLASGSNATFNGSLSIVGAGDLSVGSGDVLLASGDLILTAGDVTVTAGDVTVDAGDINVTAGDVIVVDGSSTAKLKNIVAWLKHLYGLPDGVFA